MYGLLLQLQEGKGMILPDRKRPDFVQPKRRRTPDEELSILGEKRKSISTSLPSSKTKTSKIKVLAKLDLLVISVEKVMPENIL